MREKKGPSAQKDTAWSGEVRDVRQLAGKAIEGKFAFGVRGFIAAFWRT
jgi:hypothetical protein